MWGFTEILDSTAYVFVLDVVPIPHCCIILLLCFAVRIALQDNSHSSVAVPQHWLFFRFACCLLCFHGNKDDIVSSVDLHWIYLCFSKLVIFKILILAHGKSLHHLLSSSFSVITFNFFIVIVFSFFGKRFISRYVMYKVWFGLTIFNISAWGFSPRFRPCV